MAISAFDIFKIGFGPSSSHTFGPMVACARFLRELREVGAFGRTARVTVTLYGSMGLTGKGHYADVAIVLGLEGNDPSTTGSDEVQPKANRVRDTGKLHLGGTREIGFDWDRDFLWRGAESLPKHPNGLGYTAYDEASEVVYHANYYSIGGGFVVGENESVQQKEAVGDVHVPFPFTWGDQLLELCLRRGCSVSDLMLENEKTWRSEEEIRSGLLNIAQVMQNSIRIGLQTEGIIPGGLNVKRVAKLMYERLEEVSSIPSTQLVTLSGHASAFAIAVNEVNASLGQIVTAPTMGAAGTIPAVLECFQRFHPAASPENVVKFLLTAAAVGMIIKINSTLAGAEGGCQAEVGTACAQAAAGLVEAVGGTPQQVINAAAVGLEHNLGLTCDPAGGLVQVPCIERNALAANKAINAATLVLLQGNDRISPTFDTVVKAHWEIAKDMSSKYKETSQGGLAVFYTNC
ncbi:MAG: L-serine ammonia-lyase [Pirellulaceae bacterium]